MNVTCAGVGRYVFVVNTCLELQELEVGGAPFVCATECSAPPGPPPGPRDPPATCSPGFTMDWRSSIFQMALLSDPEQAVVWDQESRHNFSETSSLKRYEYTRMRVVDASEAGSFLFGEGGMHVSYLNDTFLGIAYQCGYPVEGIRCTLLRQSYEKPGQSGKEWVVNKGALSPVEAPHLALGFGNITQDCSGPIECADDLSFIDSGGFSCSDWVGYDCSNFGLRDGTYTQETLAAVQAACPQSCALCVPGTPEKGLTLVVLDSPDRLILGLPPSSPPVRVVKILFDQSENTPRDCPLSVSFLLHTRACALVSRPDTRAHTKTL